MSDSSQNQSQSNCQQCQNSQPSPLQQPVQSSNSSDHSESYWIDYHNNNPKPTQSNTAIRLLENQIQQLKQTNKQLLEINQSLLKKNSTKDHAKELRQTLKEKQSQIHRLKAQVNSRASELQFVERSKIAIEEKQYKLRSKSSRKQEMSRKDESEKDETQSVRLHFFQTKKQFQQLSQEKIILQKQILQLQQVVLNYQYELSWMVSLTEKMLSMATKLGYLFKQKVVDRRASIKLQAKTAWRYIKHVLKYLLAVD